jgi:hypothetical protein
VGRRLGGDHTVEEFGIRIEESREQNRLTRCLAIAGIASGQITVPPACSTMSVNSGITSSACSLLSRKCTKKSPSTCHPSSSFGSGHLPSHSGVPRLTMNPSPHLDAPGATRSSPPRSSQMAAQAFGAKLWRSSVRCVGMLVRSRVQVVLSVGDMPRRAQTVDVHSAALERLKQDSRRRKPCFMKESTWSGVRCL